MLRTRVRVHWELTFIMALAFALTGGIACGKSMAEACFSDCGCRVLDADRVVWELEAPDGEAVSAIAAAFGRTVLTPEGAVDRRALAAAVFDDTEARRRLEAILHPMVRARADMWLRAAGKNDISVFSAALLFECGWDAQWTDRIVCVSASEATQIRRMVSVRRMTEAAARARLAAQMPVGEKARRSTWILENDTDDPEALRVRVSALVAQWRAGM